MGPASSEPRAPRSIALSDSQKQLFRLAKLSAAGSVAYNESVAIALRGRLDLAALRHALQELVARHDCLRTVFTEGGEQQTVLEEVAVNLARVPRPESGANDLGRVLAALGKACSEPFDLERGPLCRFDLAAIDDELHVLAITIHHIVSDGESFSVLMRELSALYNAALRGGSADLPSPMQYGEFLLAQQRLADDGGFERAKRYWLTQYADGAPVLELPLDRAHPAKRSYTGGRVVRKLDAGLSEKAAKLAREQGCTLFVALLAVYTVVLAKLCGQDDLVVGVGAANRALRGSDSLVGYAMNPLALRQRVERTLSFVEHMKRTRGVVFGALPNQHFPFPELMRLVKSQGDARSPLLSAIFNMRSSIRPPDMDGLACEALFLPGGNASFDLKLNLVEDGGEVVLWCDFNADVFTDAAASRIVDGYHEVLAQGVAEPERPIGSLSLLTELERHRLVVEVNDTARPPRLERSAVQRLESWAANSPEKVGVSDPYLSLTYAELDARANQIANRLARCGVQKQDVVALYMPPGAAFITAMLGVMKAGCAYLPIDSAYPQPRVRHILEDSKPSALLTLPESA